MRTGSVTTALVVLTGLCRGEGVREACMKFLPRGELRPFMRMMSAVMAARGRSRAAVLSSLAAEVLRAEEKWAAE
jgi:hypothetical protein